MFLHQLKKYSITKVIDVLCGVCSCRVPFHPWTLSQPQSWIWHLFFPWISLLHLILVLRGGYSALLWEHLATSGELFSCHKRRGVLMAPCGWRDTDKIPALCKTVPSSWRIIQPQMSVMQRLRNPALMYFHCTRYPYPRQDIVLHAFLTLYKRCHNLDIFLLSSLFSLRDVSMLHMFLSLPILISPL